MSFDKLETSIKGKAGEVLVTTYLQRRGLIVYSNPCCGPHPVDFWACKGKNGDLFAGEVKTYPRRACCFDTGVDRADFEKYLAITEDWGRPVWIFFVDDFEGLIYFCCASDVAGVVTQGKGKTYIPLSAMRPLCRISEATAAKLRGMGKMDYSRYTSVRPYFSKLPACVAG